MSRQRTSPSFAEMYTIKCPSCNGTGRNYNIKFAASVILAKISHHAIQKDAAKLLITVNTEIATFLNNEMRKALLKIEETTNKTLIIVSNHNPDRSFISVIILNQTKTSNEISKQFKEQTNQRYTNKTSAQEVPVVSASSHGLESPRAKLGMKLVFNLRSICRKMFTSQKQSTKRPNERSRSHNRRSNNRRNHNRRRDGKKLPQQNSCCCKFTKIQLPHMP